MNAIRTGLKNFRSNLTIWPSLYLAKLSLTLVLTLPILALTDVDLVNSQYATVLLRRWSIDVIQELIHARGNVLSSFLVMLVFYGVVVFVFRQFLNGGLYYAFLSRKRVDLQGFFSESGRLFKGNVKISIFMCMLYVPLLIVGTILASLIPSDLFGHFGSVFMTVMLLRLALVYVVLAFGVVFSDLLRQRLTAYPEERLRVSIQEVLNFFRVRVVQCYGIYLVYFVPFAVIWIFCEWLALTITGSLGSTLGVFLEFVLFQLCAFLQLGQSLAFTATIAPMFRQVQPGRFQQDIQGELELD